MRLKNILKTFCRKKNIKNRVLKRMLKKFLPGNTGEAWENGHFDKFGVKFRGKPP